MSTEPSDREEMAVLADELARDAATYAAGTPTRKLLHKAADALRSAARTDAGYGAGFEAVLSFLDELADNASPGKRHALNPILIGGSARMYAEGLRSAIAALPAPGGITPVPQLEPWRDELSEIIGHLGSAIVQSTASDDQIIMDHVKAAHEIAKIVRRKA